MSVIQTTVIYMCMYGMLTKSTDTYHTHKDLCYIAGHAIQYTNWQGYTTEKSVMCVSRSPDCEYVDTVSEL